MQIARICRDMQCTEDAAAATSFSAVSCLGKTITKNMSYSHYNSIGTMHCWVFVKVEMIALGLQLEH